MNAGTYSADLLGEGFEHMCLPLKDDYEGRVIATLVRKKPERQSTKAILYIHGFNDYFFQTELAKKFNDKGFNFYALDLRKYGRSFLEHQKLNNVRSLEEYDEEIHMSLQILKREHNAQVILMGHSTGGLIVTNYAGRNLNSNFFHGVICNSPFYEFNLNAFERKIGIPLLSALSTYFPNKKISAGLSELYGYSLHKDNFGEWNYVLAWKPHTIKDVNLSFIDAIHKGHKNIQNNLKIDVPLLVMYSSQSAFDKKWSDKFLEADAVLNVKHIKHYAHKIDGNVTTCEIKNGMHDLILSKKSVRAQVYKTMFEWIDKHFALQ
ncbi:alpha/beta hydrolase [Gelidibacter salicanalis]|uniref:Alpha/beta hydrolase n=1 Tax=Gelidibacter salicanalis TaxID=291193 RepID=A0A5C7AK31_9FLAO|nr:alpha/beta hydrolase [Gelidibacter salicanalis]TXE08149.1 alpha/beta hydrolase [Gelidibacter salicanalis]